MLETVEAMGTILGSVIIVCATIYIIDRVGRFIETSDTPRTCKPKEDDPPVPNTEDLEELGTKVTVIFTTPDGKETRKEFAYGSYECKVERGVDRLVQDGGKTIDIWPNGQYRLTLKAWKGCPTFDSFVSSRHV